MPEISPSSMKLLLLYCADGCAALLFHLLDRTDMECASAKKFLAHWNGPSMRHGKIFGQD